MLTQIVLEEVPIHEFYSFTYGTKVIGDNRIIISVMEHGPMGCVPMILVSNPELIADIENICIEKDEYHDPHVVQFTNRFTFPCWFVDELSKGLFVQGWNLVVRQFSLNSLFMDHRYEELALSAVHCNCDVVNAF